MEPPAWRAGEGCWGRAAGGGWGVVGPTPGPPSPGVPARLALCSALPDAATSRNSRGPSPQRGSRGLAAVTPWFTLSRAWPLPASRAGGHPGRTWGRRAWAWVRQASAWRVCSPAEQERAIRWGGGEGGGPGRAVMPAATDGPLSSPLLCVSVGLTLPRTSYPWNLIVFVFL